LLDNHQQLTLVTIERNLKCPIFQKVVVQGHYAYMADDEAKPHILDISNPIAPVQTGNFDTEGFAYGIAIK
jgi:hypothetical protein